MRFHLKYQNQKIFIGFQAKKYRFVFYTHGKIYSVAEWKRLIETFKLDIFDESDITVSWEDFMKYVEHLQYHSNSYWVNNFHLYDGYNFSDNGGNAVPNILK